MKPEFNSRRLFSITRAKGKMFEFGVDEDAHLAVPKGDEPAALFILAIGIVGEFAAALAAGRPQTIVNDDLQFSARFFDAFLGSRFSGALANDVLLLGASAYYLAQRPGSSFVLAGRLTAQLEEPAAESFLHWVLKANWNDVPQFADSPLLKAIKVSADLLATYFQTGNNEGALRAALVELRQVTYEIGTPRELLFNDLAVAVILLRLDASSWSLLPAYSELPAHTWDNVIQKTGFPKELWPAQVLLGQRGLFRGLSGLVQMPTSAGKTKALEIVLRSAFMSGRATLAVVVVPFRALCHEIGTTLRGAFQGEDVKVNELTDALQMDFLDQIAELLGIEVNTGKVILVLTPEKLLYILRQQSVLAKHIGLVAYDEGHQFDSGSRGIVYELLLTEIEALLPDHAQVVLISAVIKNATAVANWLVGDGAVVVEGTTLYPTSRSVAFASWAEELGQLMFFDSNEYDRYDYFVPRVIEQQVLRKNSNREKKRSFPERGKTAANDVSLYLAISVVPEGAVAVFCGLKVTADNMAKRVVEIYSRDYAKAAPVEVCDAHEIQGMLTLIDGHFGQASNLYQAAELGVFVHHNGTPHGLRLAIEHGMQNGKLQFVICTSTLAQGVNLPIRYLIVSSMYQAGEAIKTRDFLNLIGRAGRAGMHTEGLVIFSDPSALDERKTEGWRFDMAVNLLAPEMSEDTSSSLLQLIFPLQDVKRKKHLPLQVGELPILLVSDAVAIQIWAEATERARPFQGFVAKDLVQQLHEKKTLLVAVESYLMSNRGRDTFDVFQARVVQLAESTLAFSLASDAQRVELVQLFRIVSEFIEREIPQVDRQASYSKTLLGVRAARTVEQWVFANRDWLLVLTTSYEWILAVWPLFVELSDDHFFHGVMPADTGRDIASEWMNGTPYFAMIGAAEQVKATKPWGDTLRRALTAADVIGFCEGTLSFDCSLLLAAVTQFLYGSGAATDERAQTLLLFQKSLKYGLPDWLSISTFELGLADRVIALEIAQLLRACGHEEAFVGNALDVYRPYVRDALARYPGYFTAMLDSL